MTDTLTQNILEQILLYARRDKNNINFDLRKAELLRFFGIIILSGYHKLPSERDYWSNQPDLGVPIVSEARSIIIIIALFISRIKINKNLQFLFFKKKQKYLQNLMINQN